MNLTSSKKWKTVKLGDIATFNYGKSLVSTIRQDGDFSVYGSSGITGNHNEPLVKEKGYIIGRKGSVGTIYFSEKPFWPIDTVYYITEKDLSCDFNFFYYLLQTLGLNKLNFDSAVPGLNRDMAYSLEIKIPESITEQHEIAEMLGSLDDKIELLRAQNKTLESIAQAMFKEWFVDFKFPGATGKMVGSEVPEGWKVGKLGELFKITMGQSPDGESYNEKGDGVVFYQGRTEFGERFPGVRLYTTEPKRMAEKLDVLVSVRAPVGDLNQATEACCLGRGVASVSSELKSFCFYMMKNTQSDVQKFEAGGTVFGSINKDDFKNIQVIIPLENTQKEFDVATTPIDQKIFNNFTEIQTLSRLRDDLLNKIFNV